MKNNFSKIVYKKEMKDIFRDKKTIFLQILIPIILFPVIALVMKFVMDDFNNAYKEKSEVVIVSEETSNFQKNLESNKLLKVVESKNPGEDLKNLDIKAIIKIPKNIDNIENQDLSKNINIEYSSKSQDSSIAVQKIKDSINMYSKLIVEKRLSDKDIDSKILTPITISEVSKDKKSGEGLMVASMIIPMLLTIYAATGGIAAATDLGAGEKERQTLEPLLTTKANRLSILLGKYFAVVTSSSIGTVASIIGLSISTKVNSQFLGEVGTMSVELLLLSLFLFLGVASIFAGFELSISFYARNFKEAQTYLTPVTFLVLIPSYLTMSLDGMSVPYKMFHIPIVNIIALFKEGIYGIYNPIHIATVFAWLVVYLVISAVITVRMFNNEKVIFRNN